VDGRSPSIHFPFPRFHSIPFQIDRQPISGEEKDAEAGAYFWREKHPQPTQNNSLHVSEEEEGGGDIPTLHGHIKARSFLPATQYRCHGEKG
jgi:hypothetical protein